MVEAANPYNSQSGGKEMFWIEDCDDLCWSPGVVVQDRGNTFAVRCILTGDHYEIKKSDAINIHPSCLGKYSLQLLTLNLRWGQRPFNFGRIQRGSPAAHHKRETHQAIDLYLHRLPHLALSQPLRTTEHLHDKHCLEIS